MSEGITSRTRFAILAKSVRRVADCLALITAPFLVMCGLGLAAKPEQLSRSSQRSVSKGP
jgi:hypothetical protein